ncbi:ABC transporter permease [Piscirickettsia salmonis]|uniref:ABC transporter permease n=1 Tax=Piscirickettsia salmonis TaxID=1238 RepID=UPI001E63CAC1|nr:ABC transporter permease [Piscirickettsia salmonis]
MFRNSAVSSLFGARYQGFIEEMLVSPMHPGTILLGYIIGGMARGLVVGSLVLLVALFFTSMTIQHIFLTFIIAIITNVLFSAAGFINATLSKKFDDVTIIPTFILTPLTYLGGVFYSVDYLPESLRWLCYLDPIYYIINEFRYAILDIREVNFWLNMSVLCIFTFLFTGIAYYLLSKGKVQSI